MKRTIILPVLIAVIGLASCSQKVPEFANSIPGDAVAVITAHPMQIHKKGKISSFENIRESVEDEIFEQIIEDPLSSGIMLDEYIYLFARMEEEAPVMGMVAGMRDREKFESTLSRVDENIPSDFLTTDTYSYVQMDDEGIIAWNEKQLVLLVSPDNDEFPITFWTEKLDWMFDPVKEEALNSFVDFKEFQGDMKDINLWFSAGDIGKIAEKFADDALAEMPFNLDNNYSHVFCEFADGAMHISGRTNFSEEVQKNLDEVLVLNKSLNNEILKITPGGNLLMALAVSADLEKIKELAAKLPDANLGDVGSQIENSTGIAAEKWLQALSGDLTIAINGLDGEEMIPVEIFIGLGVNSDDLQKQILENMDDLMPVEEEGDFFKMTYNGNEIYSGIVHDTWVITNVKGYKKAIDGGGLDNNLLSSRFKDFSDGAMGMYLNLNLDDYPGMARDLIDQNEEKGSWIKDLTDPFEYLGMTAGGDQNLLTLKTSNPGENSLYTMLKLIDSQHEE